MVIGKLRRGYDTLLERHFKDGAELSGGQWQRNRGRTGLLPVRTVADHGRADRSSRRARRIRPVQLHPRACRSVLLITRRLASVKHADRIYVLRDGRVIEQGIHTDLLALGGQYASCSPCRPPSISFEHSA